MARPSGQNPSWPKTGDHVVVKNSDNRLKAEIQTLTRQCEPSLDIHRMDQMNRAGLPSLTIKSDAFFRIVFPRSKSGVLREGVNDLYSLIVGRPGCRVPQMAKTLKTSPKNIERWLKTLKAQNRIKFQGTTKTGGYWPLP